MDDNKMATQTTKLKPQSSEAITLSIFSPVTKYNQKQLTERSNSEMQSHNEVDQNIMNGCVYNWCATIQACLLFLILLFGLIATIFALYAYSNGLWFYKTFPGEDICGHQGEPCHYSMEHMCEQRINKPLRQSGVSSSKLISCPTRWLVIPQLFIFIIVWINAIRIYVCFYLNFERFTKRSVFWMYTSYLAFGAIAIAAGACLIAFDAMLDDVAEYCDKLLNMFRYEQLGMNTSIHVTQAGFPYPKDNPDGSYEDGDLFLDRCHKEEANVFYGNHILCGGIFAVCTGLCCIFIWLCGMITSCIIK